MARHQLAASLEVLGRTTGTASGCPRPRAPPGVFGRAGAPLWMRAELVRLGTAFPAFSFSIRPGWRGLIFEAWREAGADGLYAVITQDPRELWRELDAVPGSTSPVTDRSGGEAR